MTLVEKKESDAIRAYHCSTRGSIFVHGEHHSAPNFRIMSPGLAKSKSEKACIEAKVVRVVDIYPEDGKIKIKV